MNILRFFDNAGWFYRTSFEYKNSTSVTTIIKEINNKRLYLEIQFNTIKRANKLASVCANSL